jgi:hypothetical protein
LNINTKKYDGAGEIWPLCVLRPKNSSQLPHQNQYYKVQACCFVKFSKNHTPFLLMIVSPKLNDEVLMKILFFVLFNLVVQTSYAGTCLVRTVSINETGFIRPPVRLFEENETAILKSKAAELLTQKGYEIIDDKEFFSQPQTMGDQFLTLEIVRMHDSQAQYSRYLLSPSSFKDNMVQFFKEIGPAQTLARYSMIFSEVTVKNESGINNETLHIVTKGSTIYSGKTSTYKYSFEPYEKANEAALNQIPECNL